MANVPLRLAGPQTVTAGAGTVMTVPAGHKYRITQIHFLNLTTTQGIAISVGTLAAATELFNGTSPSLLAGGYFDWYCDLTMVAGEILQAQTTVGNGTIVVMGLDYTL